MEAHILESSITQVCHGCSFPFRQFSVAAAVPELDTDCFDFGILEVDERRILLLYEGQGDRLDSTVLVLYCNLAFTRSSGRVLGEAELELAAGECPDCDEVDPGLKLQRSHPLPG